MKVIKTIGIGTLAVLLVVVVVAGTWVLGGYLLSAQNTAKTIDCKIVGLNHLVILQNDQARPDHTNGKLCDIMTFLNKDNAIRLMAFGPHENHQPYDGIKEKALGPNQSFTITLNELGTYHFHDHIGDIIKGDFSVNK